MTITFTCAFLLNSSSKPLDKYTVIYFFDLFAFSSSAIGVYLISISSKNLTLTISGIKSCCLLPHLVIYGVFLVILIKQYPDLWVVAQLSFLFCSVNKLFLYLRHLLVLFFFFRHFTSTIPSIMKNWSLYPGSDNSSLAGGCAWMDFIKLALSRQNNIVPSGLKFYLGTIDISNSDTWFSIPVIISGHDWAMMRIWEELAIFS